MSWTVLVTARAFWTTGQKAQEELERAGCRVIRSPRAGPLNEDELIPLLADCEAVIASNDAYTPSLYAACPKLKVVSRCGVGYDRIDVAGATEAGIVVTTTPGAMTEAVGDFTFGLILAAARQIPEGEQIMRSGGWAELPGPLVYGKTLGLVGFGSIGRAVARRAVGFNMRLLAYDPAWSPSVNGSEEIPHAEFTDMDDLLAQSDFVSLHAPSTRETQKMFNADRFAKMKPSAYFINTARGALVDEPALIHALESGEIAGAAVDVYTEEPPAPDNPLRRAPNCLLTPHNAFNAFECVELMTDLCATNILARMRGESPPGILNPEVLNQSHLRR